MAPHPRTRRTTAALLFTAGFLYALFPLLRPWSDKDGTVTGLLEALSSPLWVVSHCAGAFAFVALLVASLGLRELHRETRGAAASAAGVVALTVGAGATLLYYGAETFALHAVASSPPPEAEPLIASIREGTAQITLFGLGLLLVATGGVLLAIAVWRGGFLPRWAALPLAVAMALYLPQFFTPPAMRITHGLLLAVAAAWLALVVLRSNSTTPLRTGARRPDTLTASA